MRFYIIIAISLIFMTFVQSFCYDYDEDVTDNSYLSNHVYHDVRTSSLADCATTCLLRTKCQSFGYEAVSQWCHLHDSSSTTSPQDVIDRTGWKHGDVGDMSKSLLGPCEGHNCGIGEQCIAHRVTKLKQCVPASTQLTPTDCGQLPSVSNAVISAGLRVTGSERTYTCHQDYLDLRTENVTAVIRCQVGGLWSVPSLQCTGPYSRIETLPLDTYSFQQLSQEVKEEMTRGTSTFIFFVKTCYDAVIVIYSHDGDTSRDTYKIVIGGWGNSRSVIARCVTCEVVTDHNENGIVACEEFRPFWISWENSTITVGKGNVDGENMIMSWEPASPITINHVGLSSHYHNTGTWLFLKQ